MMFRCISPYQKERTEMRHSRGMGIPDEEVVYIEENTWEVKSSSGSGWYQVIKYCDDDECPEDLFYGCNMKCMDIRCLGLCSHMYVCECPDNHPICKHIHKVHALHIKKEGKQIRNNESLTPDDELLADSSLNDFTSLSVHKKTRDLQLLTSNMQFLCDLLSSEKADIISEAAVLINQAVQCLKTKINDKVQKVVNLDPTVQKLLQEERPNKKREVIEDTGPNKKRAVVEDLTTRPTCSLSTIDLTESPDLGKH